MTEKEKKDEKSQFTQSVTVAILKYYALKFIF